MSDPAGPPPQSDNGEAARIRCPACLRPLKADAKFCTHCGRDLSQPTVLDGDFRKKRPLKRVVDAQFGKVRGVLFGLSLMIVLCYLVVPFWDRPWKGLVAADVMLIALTVVWALMSRREIGALFKKPGMNAGLYLAVAAGGLVTCALAWLMMYPVKSLLPEEMIMGIDELFPGPVVAVISVCLVPGICEEILFRGIVQTRLSGLLGARNSLIVTSVVFAAIHFNPLGFWGYLLPLGLYLGWLRHRTGSIYPSIVAHFCHNAAVLAAAYAGW